MLSVSPRSRNQDRADALRAHHRQEKAPWAVRESGQPALDRRDMVMLSSLAANIAHHLLSKGRGLYQVDVHALVVRS
jgi:hypothetical protein